MSDSDVIALRILSVAKTLVGTTGGFWRTVLNEVSLLVILFAVALVSVAQAQKTINVNPSDNLQDLVDDNPGATFVFSAGLYSLASIEPTDGSTFVAVPPGSAIFNGARNVTNWEQSGSIWTATGYTGADSQPHGSCKNGWEGCAYLQDLFLDNVALKRVTRASVKSGEWYFDYKAGKLYLGSDPTDHLLQLTWESFAFGGSATNVAIKGFIVEMYANAAQFGAISSSSGSNWLIETCEVRHTHGLGIAAGNQTTINNCYSHHNGQMGIGGSGYDILVIESEISYNNVDHFDQAWEAGGLKFAIATNLTVMQNYIHDNFGDGLWTDIDSINITYDDNYISHNWAIGIAHEISYDAVIKNNYCEKNGNPGATWMWTSQILVQNSQNVEVYNNTVVMAHNPNSPATGIGLINQNRGDGAYGEYLAIHNWIHDNFITFDSVNSSISGMNGIVADWGANLVGGNLNIFESNTYILPDDQVSDFIYNSEGFEWIDTNGNAVSYTLCQFQQLGQEYNATVQYDTQSVIPTNCSRNVPPTTYYPSTQFSSGTPRPPSSSSAKWYTQIHGALVTLLFCLFLAQF